MGGGSGAYDTPRGILHSIRVRAIVSAQYQRRRWLLALVLVACLAASWGTMLLFDRAEALGPRFSNGWLSRKQSDRHQFASGFKKMRGQGSLREAEDEDEPPVQASTPGPGWHGTAVDAGALFSGKSQTAPVSSSVLPSPILQCPSPAKEPCKCASSTPAPGALAADGETGKPAQSAAGALPPPPHWPWVHVDGAGTGTDDTDGSLRAGDGRSGVDGGALPAAHGGVSEPRELLLPAEEARALSERVASGRGLAATWTLTARQACDTELLLSGGFTPLTGFMDQQTYDSVVERMRLPPGYPQHGATGANASAGAAESGVLWPMPIALDLPAELASPLRPGDQVGLRDAYFHPVAVLTVTSVWRPDKAREAARVLGTTDDSHPGVAHLTKGGSHEWYVGGTLQGIALPGHLDFAGLRMTPRQVRAEIARRQWVRTVAFQTRNPMHRAHIELTRLAAQEARAGLLLHPVVGVTKPGDIEGPARVRCYQAVLASGRYYDPEGVILALLPLAMRMGGPREALWHAIIRLNHGARHFVVGRDHAGCKSAGGADFYGVYDAQALVRSHAGELGIEVHTYAEVVYVPALEEFLPSDRLPTGAVTKDISGTRFRGMMARGEEVPEWYSDPGVISILRGLMPPLHQRGLVLMFTGLSGGGKTTLAGALQERFSSLFPGRRVVPLDGDVARTHLSKGLGFTVGDRNANVARLGWVAAQIASAGGIVLLTAIAPFEEGRAAAQAHVTATGAGYLTVHVATPLQECARRDVKGLYAAALGGRASFDLTGVSHPYEAPATPDVVVDGDIHIWGRADSGAATDPRPAVSDSVAAVVAALVHAGYARVALALEQVSTGATGATWMPPIPRPTLSGDEAALVTALKESPLSVSTGAEGASFSSPWLAAVQAGGIRSLASVFPRAVPMETETLEPAVFRGPGCSPTWDVARLGDDQAELAYAGRPYSGSLAARLFANNGSAGVTLAGTPRNAARGTGLVLASAPSAGSNGILEQFSWPILRQWLAGNVSSPVILREQSDIEELSLASLDEQSSSAAVVRNIRPWVFEHAYIAAESAEGLKTAAPALPGGDHVFGNHQMAADEALQYNVVHPLGSPVGTLASYDVWTILRWAFETQSTASGMLRDSGFSTTGRCGIYLSPSLATTIPHALAIDPCALALIVVETVSHQPGVDSSIGVSWEQEARAIAALYPQRVLLVEVSADLI